MEGKGYDHERDIGFALDRSNRPRPRVGFVAFVQTVMLIGYGSMEWQPEPAFPTLRVYLALLVAFLVQGASSGQRMPDRASATFTWSSSKAAAGP